ncbi:unnamed protein product, partial [Ectocarpus sp. 12 AP-2014]
VGTAAASRGVRVEQIAAWPLPAATTAPEWGFAFTPPPRESQPLGGTTLLPTTAASFANSPIPGCPASSRSRAAEAAAAAVAGAAAGLVPAATNRFVKVGEILPKAVVDHDVSVVVTAEAQGPGVLGLSFPAADTAAAAAAAV